MDTKTSDSAMFSQAGEGMTSYFPSGRKSLQTFLDLIAARIFST